MAMDPGQRARSARVSSPMESVVRSKQAKALEDAVARTAQKSSYNPADFSAAIRGAAPSPNTPFQWGDLQALQAAPQTDGSRLGGSPNMQAIIRNAVAEGAAAAGVQQRPGQPMPTNYRDAYNPADFSAAITKTGADTAAELAAFLSTLAPSNDGGTTTDAPATTTNVPTTTEVPVVDGTVVDPVVDPDPYVPPYVPPGPAPLPASDPSNFYRPADLDSEIRRLMGELTTTDYSAKIREMIGERRTGVTEAESRRGTQIDEIARQLGIDVGALETGRLEQQKALIDAVAGRASGLTGGVADRLATARADLGPQVTDEFEQVAQLVGGQAGSQAASSQDAMSRLAQIANMASAERAAAPGQLGAEAKLALGDEAFRMLQGLDQEQTQRLLSESMRQEEFNTQRDEAMIGALLGDMGRREDFLTREAERLQGQAFQSDEQAAQRLWQGDQATDQRKWQGEQAVDEREWREGESVLDRALRVSEAELGRDLQRDQMAESGRQRSLDRKAQTDAATTNFQRQQQQIREANTEQDRIRIANSAAESAAAAAVAAGSAEAASFFMGVDGPEGAALWDALPEAAKTQMYKDKVAAEDTQGARWNAGSYANMVGKYGQENSSHILHAEHMVGMTEDEQKVYLEALQAEVGLEGGAMDADDIGRIRLFFAEIDAANKAVQAANHIAAQQATDLRNRSGGAGTGGRGAARTPVRGDLTDPAGASMRPGGNVAQGQAPGTTPPNDEGYTFGWLGTAAGGARDIVNDLARRRPYG